MKCPNCKTEIPANSRFCLNCGASQQLVQLKQTEANTIRQSTAADGGGDTVTNSSEERFNRVRRNISINPDIDMEARDRYSFGERGLSCVTIPFFVFIGILTLIPGIPILAFLGIPGAIILTPLTFQDVGHLQEKLRATRILNRLPGFKQGTRITLTISVFLYLTVGSILSMLILIAQSHPH